MRTLHSVPIGINQFIMWFGEGLRCEDHYHDGYDFEREDINGGHGDCIRNAARLANQFTNGRDYIGICYCQPCVTNFPMQVHYMINTPENNTQNDEEGNEVCQFCHHGQHPTPPEER